MKKDITPRNDKYQPHGYWEIYFNNGKLMFKCIFINDKLNGFSEWYNFDGKTTEKNYYL